MYTQRYNARYRGPIYSEHLTLQQLQIIADLSTLTNMIDQLKVPAALQAGDIDDRTIYDGRRTIPYIDHLRPLDSLVSTVAKVSYISEYNQICPM